MCAPNAPPPGSSGQQETPGTAGWNGAGQAVDAAGNVIPGAQQIIPQRAGVTPTFAPPPSTTGYTRPAPADNGGTYGGGATNQQMWNMGYAPGNPASANPSAPVDPGSAAIPQTPISQATPQQVAMGEMISGKPLPAPATPLSSFPDSPANKPTPAPVQAATTPQAMSLPTDPRLGVTQALMRRFRGYWG